MRTILVILLLAGCQAPAPEVLIIGDSHAQKLEAYAPKFPGWKVRYAGIGSQTSAQIEVRFSDALQGCKKVFIMAGTNDVWLHKDAAPQAVYRMAERAKAAGCEPILFSIPQIARSGEAPGSKDVNRWNEAVQKAGLSVLDGYAISLEPGMLYDGVHFSADGYKKLAELMASY